MGQKAVKYIGAILLIACLAYIYTAINSDPDPNIGSVTGMAVAGLNSTEPSNITGSVNGSAMDFEDLIADGLDFVVQQDAEDIIPTAADNTETETSTGSTENCSKNYTINALRHNVRIKMTGPSGKIDVIVKDNTPGNVVCQNGMVVEAMPDCVPDGLVDFLNTPVKVSDLVEFRCSSGKITQNVQECLPAYSTSPPEEFFDLKCRDSNMTISSLDCKDECFAERIRGFIAKLDQQMIENNKKEIENKTNI